MDCVRKLRQGKLEVPPNQDPNSTIGQERQTLIAGRKSPWARDELRELKDVVTRLWQYIWG